MSALSRHRMSEADEDDELLEDDLGLDGTSITRFTESPWCKLLNSCVFMFCV